jgi:hypothetical protein
MSRQCISCGGRPTTREPAIPQWTRRYFPIRGHFATERSVAGAAERQFPSQTLGPVVKVACKACNSGWMSDLESRAQATVARLVEANGLLHHAGVTLSRADQATIALWAAKTFAVLEFTSEPSREPYFLRPERANLRRGIMPLNAFIWLASYAGQHASLCVGHELAFRSPITASVARGYQSTVAVRGMAIQLMTFRWSPKAAGASRIEFAAIDAWPKITTQIWPIVAEQVWPPVAILDDEGWDDFADHWVSRYPAK